MNLIKKTAVWTAAALLSLLIIAAIALPRVINTEAVKTAIERTISRDLGGTLSYDRVVLSILPRPRIVLQKPKIEIPRKVTAELDSLDIYPAILPLLTGTFRIHDVHLGHPHVTLLLQEEAIAGKQQKKRQASPPGPSPEEVLGVAAKNMPGITIIIDNGVLVVMRRSDQVLSVGGLEARFVFVPAQPGAGMTDLSADTVFRISGSAACSADAPGLPAGPLLLTIEHFEARPRTVSFSGTRARFMDLSLSLSGSIDDYPSDRRKADVTLSGTAGPNILLWLRDSASLSPLFTLRSPLSLSDTRVIWQQSGTLYATGHAAVREVPSIAFDVRRSSTSFSLKRLAIRDRESQALITAELSDRVLDVSFSGNLTLQTLNSLLEQQRLQFGRIKGDIKATLPLDHLIGSSAEGTMEAEHVVVPWRKQVPLIVDRLSLSAHGRGLTLDPAAISLGGSRGVFSGTISAHDDGLVLDLAMTSPDVAWSDLQELFTPKKAQGEAGEVPEKKTPEKWTVRGALRVDVDSLRGQRFAFQPVRGEIQFEKDRTRYEVREAAVCGIGLSGSVAVSPGGSDLSIRMSAKQQQLAPTLTCLAGSDLKVTGSFDLQGSLAGRGPNEELLRSAAGQVAFAAHNGRVYNDFLVTPILRYKKIADLLRDRTGDAKKNGIPYETFGLRGVLNAGVFTVTEGVVKSPVMNLAAHGTVDLSNEKLDLTVLLAPYKTVDAVVRHIPLLGKVLGGTLVTVPLGVQGPFKHVKVTALPPSAISEGLLGIMKRTLELPFTVVEDLSRPERSAATSSTP